MFDRFFTPEHHRKKVSPWVGAPMWAIELGAMLFTMLDLQKQLEEQVMAAIDDLKSALADLATSINNSNAEIEALLTKIATPGTSDADIQAAVQQIRDLTGSINAEVDKAKTAAG